nr:hypothetical protein [Tanacetum cinerariifolium]
TASRKTVKETSLDSAPKDVHAIKYKMLKAKKRCMTHEGKVDSGKALDVSLVNTECSEIKSEKYVTSSTSRNNTHAADANKGPMAKVQLTAGRNVPANKQHHSEQSKPIYDIYLLEKVDSNTTPDSINISHRGGEIDQDATEYQVKSLFLNAELFEPNMVEKEVYNELSNRFLQLENIVFHLNFQYNKRKKVFKVTKHVRIRTLLNFMNLSR